MKERNKKLVTRFIEDTNTEDDIISNTSKFRNILKGATKELVTIPPKERDEAHSDKTKDRLEQRKETLRKQHVTNYNTLDNDFGKNEKEDKTHMIINTLDTQQWNGYQRPIARHQTIQKGISTKPICKKNEQKRKHVTQKQRARTAADFSHE